MSHYPARPDAPAPRPARLSTAVMLTRGSGADLEVYLARRNPKLRFFGGYWALPGGVVDESDIDGERDGDGTHRRCALRELFEELGVLPAGFDWGEEERRSLRQALLEDKQAELDWRARVDSQADRLQAFAPLAYLTTPPFAPLRYRTRFLHMELPPGQEPDIWPGELMEGRFFRPAELLAEWRKGELPVVPPALVMLELWQGDRDEWLAAITRRAAASEDGRLHTIRHTPGISVLPLRTPTLPPATTTNTYIVGERDLYVVDPATYEESERQKLFDHLDERVTAGARLAGVIVTHHHHDHVGSVKAVAERYDVAVYAHPRTLERLPDAVPQTVEVMEGYAFDLGQAPDGTRDWMLIAHYTPGHDQGHLVLRDSRYRALIAGDLASTVSTILIDPPEGHLATYLDSVQRVRDLGIGTLHPAHGPAAWEGDKLLRRYLTHRAMREESLLRGLRKGLAEISELVPFVYADTDDRMHGVAARSLQAGLEKLREEGRAQEHEAGRWSALGE